jgi:predicted MPP superfamily phosphohydrolase
MGGGAAVGSVVLGASMVRVGGALEVNRLTVPAPEAGLRGLRLGFVSDIHRSELVGREEVEGIAAALDAEELDLLLIGGDLATIRYSPPAMIDEALEILGGIRAPLGRLAVQGNHDVDLGGSKALRRAGRFGITALVNEGVRLERGGGALFVAGIDDHKNGRPDIKRAFREHGGEPVLFLTHNPDALVERMGEAPPVWLALAGHLHGGQIRVPFIGAPYNPSRYPRIFDWGWAKGTKMRAYVTRGTGVVVVPMRVNCPPEICVFELT